MLKEEMDLIFLIKFIMSAESFWKWLDILQCRYSAVNFLQDPHESHPAALR